jgi:hypothetical protein
MKNKEIYYNRTTKTTFTLDKRSNLFKDKEGNEVPRETVLKHLAKPGRTDALYMDLTLYPAHLSKSYGETTIPEEGKILWFHTNKEKTFSFLAYVRRIDREGIATVFYSKVLTNGKISNKVLNNKHFLFDYTLPKEHYHVDISVRRLPK